MCYIVHCLILNGKYQGYLVIYMYTAYKPKGYKRESERNWLEIKIYEQFFFLQ